MNIMNLSINVIDSTYPIINRMKVLMEDNKFHDWMITDVEGTIGIKVCPDCKNYIYNTKLHHNRSRFEQHMKIYKENGGKLIRELSLDTAQIPYAPQPDEKFLLMHNIIKYFKPTRYYIPYDFETLENTVNEEITERTTIDANLVPFIVSSTGKLP